MDDKMIKDIQWMQGNWNQTQVNPEPLSRRVEPLYRSSIRSVSGETTVMSGTGQRNSKQAATLAA